VRDEEPPPARPRLAARLEREARRRVQAPELAREPLEERRARGASQSEIIDAFPRALLKQVGYYGPAAGAAAAFKRLAQGLDLAIVRVVASRPGPEAVLTTMQACRPELCLG